MDMHAFIVHVIHGFKGSASFMCVYDRYWYFTFLTLCYLLSILNDGVGKQPTLIVLQSTVIEIGMLGL